MNRFFHRRCAAFLCAAALTIAFCFSACRPSFEPVSKSGFYFDTIISLTAYGSRAESALEDAFALCERYEKLWSKTNKRKRHLEYHPRGRTAGDRCPGNCKAVKHHPVLGAKRTVLIDPTVTPLSDLWNFTGDPAGPVPSQEDIDMLLSHVNYENIIIDSEILSPLPILMPESNVRHSWQKAILQTA